MHVDRDTLDINSIDVLNVSAALWCAFVLSFNGQLFESSTTYGAASQLLNERGWGLLFIAQTIVYVLGILIDRCLLRLWTTTSFIFLWVFYTLTLFRDQSLIFAAGLFGILAASLVVRQLQLADRWHHG